jgi:hypothetical protein
MGSHTFFAAGRAPHTIVRLLAGTLISVPLVLISQPSNAAASDVELTFDQAAFLSSQPIVSTEDFNEFATPTEYPPKQRRVVIDSVRYRSVDPSPPSWVIDIVGPPTPDNALTRRFNSGPGVVGPLEVAVAIRDGKSVRAVGFIFRPFFTSNNQFELIATEANGATTSFFLPPDIDATYIGLSSPNLIKKVFITQHSELTGSITNFAFDDVSRSPIITTR